MGSFTESDAVARYAEGPVRQVPGFLDLQKMAAILLAERAGAAAEILVLGAGGGLELRAFADWHPGWQFTGVDPSGQMLALAAQTAAAHLSRIDLVQGYIDDAPLGPFDAACCLLVLHFIPPEARVPTLRQIRARLKPGAPLVVAQHSIPQDPAERALWLDRYAAFAAASGVPLDNARRGAEAIGQQLPIAAPEQDAAYLRAAGFTGISLFYAAFTFRGWVAYAP